MPGGALEKADGGEGRAVKGAMAADGFGGVMGAGRRKTAAAAGTENDGESRGERELVKLDEPEQRGRGQAQQAANGGEEEATVAGTSRRERPGPLAGKRGAVDPIGEGRERNVHGIAAGGVGMTTGVAGLDGETKTVGAGARAGIWRQASTKRFSSSEIGQVVVAARAMSRKSQLAGKWVWW